MHIPGCEMENVQERSDSIACGLANLGLLHQGIVEQSDGVLLFFAASIATSLVALHFLLDGSRNVKAHLNELVLASTRLLALSARTAQVTVGASIILVCRS